MRVKGGVVSSRRHKRMVKLASGMRGRRGNCFKLAKRGVQKALQYAYRDRAQKKRTFRTLWITRINAGARLSGISYSKLAQGLKLAKITLDRKSLSELAIHDPKAFGSIVERAKQALA